jgi:hypothetical protein
MNRQASHHSTHLSGEEGSSLILVIFSSVLALSVALAGASATSLYLERKRLLDLADSASLAAADGFRLDQVRVVGDTLSVSLDSATVQAAAHTFLRDACHTSPCPQLVRAYTADGTSATVELSGVWKPPIVSDYLPLQVPLRVTATARNFAG